MTELKKLNLRDITPDKNNLNLGTERGKVALDASLSRYGAGRSILLDKHNRIIAGNQTYASAGELGFENVVVVESDGKSIVAVKRTDLDLDETDGKMMAIADNRVGSLNLSWDYDALKSDFENPEMDMSPFFTEKEVIEFSVESGDAWQEEEEPVVPQNNYSVKVMCVSHEEKLELAQRLESEGYRVTI